MTTTTTMEREYGKTSDPTLVETAKELKAAIDRLYTQLNSIEYEIHKRMEERGGATKLDTVRLTPGTIKPYKPQDLVRVMHQFIEGAVVPYERLVEEGAYVPPQDLPGEWHVKVLKALGKEDPKILDALESIQERGRPKLVYDD
jgi:hypothetical protein